MFVFVALLVAAADVAPAPVSRNLEVSVPDDVIRLADLAPLSARHGMIPGAPFVLARFPRARSQVRLSRAALVALLRRSGRAGGLSIAPDIESVTFVRARVPLKPVDEECAILTRPVADGAALDAEEVETAPCGPWVRGALRFDRRDRLVRAADDLPAGTALGRIALAPSPIVDRGANLTLVARAGAVEIRRPVTALQPGRPGGRIFVKDAEGGVFAAPLPSGERGQ